MEEILLEFIGTLDASWKKWQAQVGDGAGISKLTIHQLNYIDAVNMLGNPTITELARQLHITKASVTTAINKLVMLGFVTKSQSSEDRRVFYVHLTPAAEQLVAAKYRALQAYGELIRNVLSEEEVGQFRAILTKLISHFKHA